MRIRILVVIGICLVLLATAMLSSKISAADPTPSVSLGDNASTSINKTPLRAPLPLDDPKLNQQTPQDQTMKPATPSWFLNSPAYLRFLKHRNAHEEYLRMSRKWDHVRRKPCIRVTPGPGYRRYIMKRKLRRKPTTQVDSGQSK